MKKIITHILPAFSDNYLFCLEISTGFWAIDPGDFAPVQKFLAKQTKPLIGILLTHHHNDHCGGAFELAAITQAPIFCSELTKTHFSKEKRAVCRTLPADSVKEEFDLLATPGHTLDHISFFHRDSHSLFSGDVVFGFGCGRLFEGSPEQMMTTLNLLKTLPADTKIYCAHEYTAKNLAFAKSYLPPADHQKAEENLRQRFLTQAGKSVPLDLGFEIQFNPFLRETDLARWRHLRQERNQF